ncbi:heme-binding protein [Amorphus sp. 3PC139-8]|uniref:GlcG/HbpS family heme-binding protein n=1 Tax=Amorphus sp. 3PC139-8 TaxID=2735676 RepID=UPI00345CA9CA
MTELTLDHARTIIETAFAKGEELGLKPLGVVVLDAGGHPVAMMRQDGSSFMRLDIAGGKAYGAIGVGRGSRFLNDAAIERPHFVAALSGVAGGRMVPVPGGVVIKDTEGRALGGVGVSGDTSDNDEACAVAGIEAAGLVAIVD